jgi:hypothetical protein
LFHEFQFAYTVPERIFIKYSNRAIDARLFHSLGPRALPTILPSLSRTKVVGSALTANPVETSPLESRSAVNDSFLFLNAHFVLQQEVYQFFPVDE